MSFEQLPEEVVHQARRRLLDALGVMFAGASGEAVAATRAVALALGRQEQASLVGDARRTSVEWATLVNSTALRYLDYMDGHAGPYPCHACCNIPPILAIAEQAGASGRAVIRAIVLGYEVQIRFQQAAGDPDITAHGWAGSSNLGFSVPVAIGGLLGLTHDQLAHAIAISCTHAPALDAVSRGQLPASKSCLDGAVAMWAVIASLLAREGLTGPLASVEGVSGYREAIAGRLDLDILLGPVDRFRILDVYDKRFNAGKYGQTAVAAGLAVRAALAGGWPQVQQVTLRLAERDYRQQMHDDAARRRPRTRDTANHSVVYCLAAAMVDGDLLPEQLEPERLDNADILQLVDRVVLEPDPELTAYWPSANPAEVEVVTADGSFVRERVVYPPGHPRNPLTDEQLEAKFRGLVAGILPPDRAEAVIQAIRRLEDLETIEPLMRLLRAAPPDQEAPGGWTGRAVVEEAIDA